VAKNAMFEGLVFDETGNPTKVDYVGQNACYVVLDDDFKRYVNAEDVDVQVLRALHAQVEGERELAVGAMMQMLGQDDLFTKAALESSINNMEKAVGTSIPPEARQYLAMLGFRITIDVHGVVAGITMPGSGDGSEE